MEKKDWKEFKDSGFLWLVNTTLHVFGWSIVFQYDMDNNLLDVYPARVKFRGFETKVNDDGYTKLTKYMDSNASQLLKEINEE